MVLIVSLFSLSTILFFINIEPFTVVGIFLSLCYLPGLCIFAILKREALLFEDLILSFPCSIGVSSASILAMLFIGVPVEFIPVIIHLFVGAAVVFLMITRNKGKAYTVVEIKKQELLFCFFALLITLLLSIPFFLGANRNSIAAHVFHHSLMVTQILNGIFPPENPGLGGTIIGYYWGFHALIAALTVKTNINQIQIVFILNVLSLYAIFCIAYSFAKAFNLSEGLRYIMPLALIGLMRIDAGLLFIINAASGKLMSFNEITSSPIPMEAFDILANWLQGLSWYDSRLLFTRKFYNISAMPLAICLCLSYLMLLLLTVKEKAACNKVYPICTGFVIFACFINYPPLAIFLLLHAPLWTCYIFLSTSSDLKGKLRESFSFILPYITAILCVLPYLLFVIKSRDISSSGQGGIFSVDFYSQSLKNIVVFLVPLPVILYGGWTALKRLSFPKGISFLLIGTAVCLFLTVFTRWPFDNSYKFNYIMAFFFALFFVLALSNLLPLITNRLLRQLVTSAIFLFLSLTPLLVEASYFVSSFSTEFEYVFSGRHIIFSRDKGRNRALDWIRKNTPPNALLMLSYVKTKYPCCGMNSNYEQAAIAERTLYVITDTDYTVSNPEFDKRIRFREKLFENAEEADVIEYFNSLHRPVYLLVESDLPKDFYHVEDRFKNFPDNPGIPFELLFQNNIQRVYLIRFNQL